MKRCRNISHLYVIRIVKLIVTYILCYFSFIHTFSSCPCFASPVKALHSGSGRDRQAEVGKWSRGAKTFHQVTIRSSITSLGVDHDNINGQRNLASIGSAPPKCVKKCLNCTPCQPIRVPVQPGRAKLRLMEYYPEAWRCKCKNKLYMP